MIDPVTIGWRKSILFYSFIGMMISLFFYRELLSIIMTVFICVSILQPQFKRQVQFFFSAPLLWGMTLLFLIPLVTGIWSENKFDWLGMVRIKIPLLLLPISFAHPVIFTKREWNQLGIVFLLCVFSGTAWTMYHYLADVQAGNQAYLHAKSIITPLENDRVRFSWLVSVGALVAIWIGIRKKIDGRKNAWPYFLLAAWLIIFLHLLAVRTGLISIYLVALAMAVKIIFSNKGRWIAALLIGLIIIIPIAAWLLLPTFQNRVKYFRYDFSYLKKTEYLPGANDGVRVISLKAGWAVMNEHPITGVGFGDISSETNKWYETHYPAMTDKDKILPGSEWLIYGTGSGWPGMIIFTIVMMIPFFLRMKNRFFWRLLNLTAAFSLVFDIGLEVQFGVFLYCIIMLWCWQWLRSGQEIAKS